MSRVPAFVYSSCLPFVEFFVFKTLLYRTGGFFLLKWNRGKSPFSLKNHVNKANRLDLASVIKVGIFIVGIFIGAMKRGTEAGGRRKHRESWPCP
jgi:hypothetical protein